MRYLFIILLLIILSSCDDPEYELVIMEVRFTVHPTDTIMVIAPEDARFYLKKSRQTGQYYLHCDGVGSIAQNVVSYKRLN